MLQFTYQGCQGSEQHPYLPLTPQAPLDLLVPMAQVAEQLNQQPGPVAEPSLALAPSQQQCFGSLVKWAGVIHSNEDYVASKIQRGSLGIVFPFWVSAGSDTITHPSPQKGYLDIAPHHCTPRNH